MEKLDVWFDFTTDTLGFWNGFWENNDGLGASDYDPDSESRTLQRYHQLLWSRKLPNGKTMRLEIGKGRDYLTWNGFSFGSDSITASFRYKRYRQMIERVEQMLPDYRAFMENFLRRAYTIGGEIIFPKRTWGINRMRGFNRKICDRWDLTLECIRKYYNGEKSPLYDTLVEDKAFFDLFRDFKGYVDFFCLQDCVSPDYKSVVFWIGSGEFNDNPLPQTPNEYLLWIERELEFVEKRNNRIQNVLRGG